MKSKLGLMALTLAASASLATAQEDPLEEAIFASSLAKVESIGLLAIGIVGAALAIAIVIKYAKKWGKG